MSDPAALDSSRTALLIMDYQPGILANYADAQAAIGRLNELLPAARSAGLMIGYVRVALTTADASAVPPHNRTFAAIAASGRLSDGDPDREIDGRIDSRPDEPVFRKRRVGALSTTDLHAALQARGINTLVLAGVSTSGVVLSTVRDAADRDYRLIVLGDLCLDSDLEVHRVLLEKVIPRQAAVISSPEFASSLSRLRR